MEAGMQVDGKMGRSFTVNAGVRQGCVIAGILFNDLSTIFCKRPSHSCPLTSNLAFKLTPSLAVHCRQPRGVVPPSGWSALSERSGAPPAVSAPSAALPLATCRMRAAGLGCRLILTPAPLPPSASVGLIRRRGGGWQGGAARAPRAVRVRGARASSRRRNAAAREERGRSGSALRVRWCRSVGGAVVSRMRSTGRQRMRGGERSGGMGIAGKLGVWLGWCAGEGGRGEESGPKA
eukprot:365778-Chlamydomonas_euryale.AAC.9